MTESDGNSVQVVEQPRKSSFLRFLVTSVLMLGVGVTGTLLGPRLLALAHKASLPKAAVGHESGAREEIPVNSIAMQPLIVDVRGKSGEPHHVRVGLTAEMTSELKKGDFEKLQPRGREVAISYLRGRTFEDLTEPSQFEKIKKDLGEQVSSALGKKYTSRIIVTDYVVQ